MTGMGQTAGLKRAPFRPFKVDWKVPKAAVVLVIAGIDERVSNWLTAMRAIDLNLPTH